MSKRIKILLVGSLVLNIIFIGTIVGHSYKRWTSHPWHQVKADLSPEARNLVGRSFQGAFRDIRPLGNKARKARAELVKILTADEFDEAAFDKAAAGLLDIRGDMHGIKIKAMRDVAGQLSVEDRSKMANRITRMVGGGHERRVKRERKIMPFTPERKPHFGPQPE